MAIEDRVRDVVEPITTDLDLELVDIVYGGGRLRITIDKPEGLDARSLTKATRMISEDLDETDPIKGTYTLEVSSPGVERTLRTPEHYLRSIGEQVSLKLKPNAQGERRIRGELTAATDSDITVVVDGESKTLDYAEITKAKTIFDWGPGPKPGKTSKPKKSNTSASNSTDDDSVGNQKG